jgi:hypothetical protein
MKVCLVVKPGHPDTGVGRYAAELKSGLLDQGHEVAVIHPVVPLPGWLLRSIRLALGWDLEAFLRTYPLWANYPSADLYHLTSQNLATLMLLRRPPGRVVITVHDIIPWLVHKDSDLRLYHHRFEEWFDRLALRGIRKADWILSDSNFSAVSLASVLNGSLLPIDTVYLGIS